jgi:S-adenosyl-L-methionine hydrolase (adenosine-forming)
MEPPPYIVSAPGKDSRTNPDVKVITLLTDFGLKDPYVGIMKGVILSINPGATIVDITHDIRSQDIEEAAFLIEEYNRYFPPGTIHVGIIDPTVGSPRRPIIVSKDNNIFIGPDNGLFTVVLDGDAEVYLIESPDFMLREVSSTFHGRDIFAPAAAHASTGFHPSAFGGIISDPVRLDNMFPVAEGHSLKGKIVRFDRFGNAITNIGIDFLKDFLGNRSFEVLVGGMVFTALSKSYYESEFTCLTGSSGHLEFGYFRGSFKEKSNSAKNDLVVIRAL